MVIHTQIERIRKSWKEFMKTTLKISSHNFPLGRFPLQIFQKIQTRPPLPLIHFFFCLILLLDILSLSSLPFTYPPTKIQKRHLLSSKTFKLLLGYQYGHIIVRSLFYTKVIRCAKMFLLLTRIIKTKEFTKIENNISLYFGNLGTAIFKEHFSVPVSITKNFQCNLALLF